MPKPNITFEAISGPLTAISHSDSIINNRGQTTVSHQTGSPPVFPGRVARAAIPFPSRTTMTDLADPVKPLHSPIIRVES